MFPHQSGFHLFRTMYDVSQTYYDLPCVRGEFRAKRAFKLSAGVQTPDLIV